MESHERRPFEVRIIANALNNIYDIAWFIKFVNQQPINAVKVVDTIEATFDRIRLNPYSFKECEQLQTKKKSYRQAVCLSWLIIYKVTTDEIIILGIIHKATKPSKIKTLRGKT